MKLKLHIQIVHNGFEVPEWVLNEIKQFFSFFLFVFILLFLFFSLFALACLRIREDIYRLGYSENLVLL